MSRASLKHLARIAGVLAVAGMRLDGARVIRPVDIILYVDGLEVPPGQVDLGARYTVTQMYARLGIVLAWRNDSPKRGGKSAGAVAIQIRFTSQIPSFVSTNALAFALPFADGTNAITVMYRRIEWIADGKIAVARSLLAHVLAHEIGHVLQGTTLHSETGVMQPTFNDYSAMVRKPLEFTQEDAARIVAGLTAWKLRSASERR